MLTLLEILYADAHMAVCVKPAGVLSQDAGENSMPSLLRQQLGAENIYVIHRLDREVGGVMVYALSKKAAAALGKAVQERTLEKEYLAVLCGTPAEPEAVLEDLLYHDPVKNKTYTVRRMRKGVRDARLEYCVKKSIGERTLVRVRLHTGRTHQIRVQFASRGFPLVGDGKYGGKTAGVGLGLWSYRLAFPDPITGEQRVFEVTPPEATPWKEFT